MYTSGIRKILDVPKHYGYDEELFKLADQTGHDAVTHNGIIYVRSDKSWVKTCFTIRDFDSRSKE